MKFTIFVGKQRINRVSLPVRGAWIEITSPAIRKKLSWSLPVRGAWIEIQRIPDSVIFGLLSLPVRGAWIEMDKETRLKLNPMSRSPCGERGLKWVCYYIIVKRKESLPVRGAWIEIRTATSAFRATRTSLPVRGAWIEIQRAGEERDED